MGRVTADAGDSRGRLRLIPVLLLLVLPAIGLGLGLDSLFRAGRTLSEDPRWIVGRLHSDVLYLAIALNETGSRVDSGEAVDLQDEVAILRNRLFVARSDSVTGHLPADDPVAVAIRDAEARVLSMQRRLRALTSVSPMAPTADLRDDVAALQGLTERLVVTVTERDGAAELAREGELRTGMALALLSLGGLITGLVYLLWRAAVARQRMAAALAAKERAEAWERKLSTALDQCPVGVLLADRNGRVEYLNRAYTRISGRGADDLVGRCGGMVPAGMPAEVTLSQVLALVLDGCDWEREQRNTRVDGSVYWEHVRVTPVRAGGDQVTHVLAIVEEVTQRKEQEAEVERHAYYDGLTGLPNRRLAMDRLDRALLRRNRTGEAVATYYVDLDDFKSINDAYGHESGDALLVEVARRLQGVMRDGDTVARLGGDEFLVVAEGLGDALEARRIGEKLLGIFARRFTLAGESSTMAGSVGFAVSPEDGADSRTLLRNADAAMYRAKALGKNACFGFAGTGRDDGEQRRRLAVDLDGALERNEFTLFYQPVVDLASGEVTGAEALLRWRHPSEGVIPPERFMPLAEARGQTVAIGKWVIARAIETAARWRRTSATFVMSVNVSRRQAWGHGVRGVVAGELARCALPAEHFAVEITEALFASNRERSEQVLAELRELGVGVVVDDFGLGYASLSHLRRFPVSGLKIDRSIIRAMIEGEQERALVGSMLAAAQSMGLRVVAEGVETVEQRERLLAAECIAAQGHLFGEAVEAARFEADFLGRVIRPDGGTQATIAPA